MPCLGPAVIKEGIRSRRGCEFRALWEEALACQKAPIHGRKRKKPQEEVSQETRNASRNMQLVREGQ